MNIQTFNKLAMFVALFIMFVVLKKRLQMASTTNPVPMIKSESSKTIITLLLLGFMAYGMVSKLRNMATPATPAKVEPAQGTLPATSTDLTLEQARALVLEKWGDCTPDTCSEVLVVVEKGASGAYTVSATYEGLRDDSTAATKKVAPATYSNGAWILGEASSTHRCQPGRGHQDFSTELCF